MNSSFKKLLVIFLAITVIFGSLLLPVTAHAGFSIKKLFHSIGRGIKWTVNLPNKATRFLGPVLGPIAANIITGNLASHHKLGSLFTKLQKADRIVRTMEEQKQALSDVKGLYRDQASAIRKQIDKLKQADQELKTQLVKTDMTFAEYQDKFIAIRNTIESYEGAANKFENAANNLDMDDIVKMAGTNLIKDVLGEIKHAVIFEASQEIEKFLDPALITSLVERGGQGADGLLDILISGDLDRLRDQGNLDGIDFDALKDKVRNQIKNIIKNNKDELKNNWSSKLDEVINNIVNEIKEEGAGYTAGDETKETNNSVQNNNYEETNFYTDDELVEHVGEIPRDEFGCGPGYVWRRMSGVGCVQENCSDAGGHYSYTQDCICGFVDSKPGDLTKTCSRPANYVSCASCVYACISPEEKCPDEK